MVLFKPFVKSIENEVVNLLSREMFVKFIEKKLQLYVCFVFGQFVTTSSCS
jgi:hypothetical protein